MDSSNNQDSYDERTQHWWEHSDCLLHFSSQRTHHPVQNLGTIQLTRHSVHVLLQKHSAQTGSNMV